MVRTVRDLLSLAVTVPILAGVGVQIAGDLRDDGGLEFASFCRANLPYGSVAASYGLMCAELIKAPLTTGLSYQTISRHHLVDDYLLRSEASLRSIDTVLSRLCSEHGVNYTGTTNTKSFAKLCCQFGELARHASTLFTLVNYTIAPVRVGLFVANEVPLWSAHEPARADPVGGLLRLVSSTSDTLRAALSQVGTHCRDQLFTLRMRTLLSAADELHARVSVLIDDPALREPTEAALEQARILCTMSANDVIERLSSDEAALEIALRSSAGQDSLRMREQIGRHLEPFGIGMSRLIEPDRSHLFVRPPENHWGKVTASEAHWGHRIQLPLRVAYRLTLMLQHWLSALLHRMTKPCQPAGPSLAPR